jgi:hypothetical protein
MRMLENLIHDVVQDTRGILENRPTSSTFTKGGDLEQLTSEQVLVKDPVQ